MDDSDILLLISPYMAMIEKFRADKLSFYFRITSDDEDLSCDLTVGHPLPSYIDTAKYNLKMFGPALCKKFVYVLYEHCDGVPVVYKFEM